MKRRRTSAFTLIELIIVIGLLGALAAVMLPSLTVKRVESLQQVVGHDMYEVRSAFQRFYHDCVPQPEDLENICDYGLEILTRAPSECAGTWSFVEYDPGKDKGWRGPYVEMEGERLINPDSVGQDRTGGTVTVKVIEDPFTDSDDGHYYRVVAPPVSTNPADGHVHKEMLIVCVVGDESSGDDEELNFSLGVGETLDDHTVVNDVAIRLCPYVE
jgi:type II secretory pathway pseudopilin PulG